MRRLRPKMLNNRELAESMRTGCYGKILGNPLTAATVD